MTLPVEKMKLSDKELNCMKMCQKAPKCANFSINPGEACIMMGIFGTLDSK